MNTKKGFGMLEIFFSLIIFTIIFTSLMPVLTEAAKREGRLRKLLTTLQTGNYSRVCGPTQDCGIPVACFVSHANSKDLKYCGTTDCAKVNGIWTYQGDPCLDVLNK